MNDHPDPEPDGSAADAAAETPINNPAPRATSPTSRSTPNADESSVLGGGGPTDPMDTSDPEPRFGVEELPKRD